MRKHFRNIKGFSVRQKLGEFKFRYTVRRLITQCCTFYLTRTTDYLYNQIKVFQPRKYPITWKQLTNPPLNENTGITGYIKIRRNHSDKIYIIQET